MPRYRIQVAYEGTDFHGWQKQESPEKGSLRTAQGVLEKAVQRTVGEPVLVNGASRTDSGVHAVGQVAAFTSMNEVPVDRLPMALTSRLPDDIQVARAWAVQESFDPISDCVKKGYSYTINHGMPPDCWPPLFDRRTVYHTPHHLELEPMQEAASRLVGRNDFAGFANTNHGRESTIRTIVGCRVHQDGPHRMRIDVSGDGFLYHMVRIIAGTLMEIGRGHRQPELIDQLLATPDRSLAGQTLPPEGLCLRWIEYPDACCGIPFDLEET